LVVLNLIAMIIFLLNRFIYFLLLLFGVFNNPDYLMVLFSELPALVYFSMLSFMVIKWAEIYHFTMNQRTTSVVFGALKPVVIGANLAMYLFMLVLIIVYFALPVPKDTFNCSIVEQNLISRDIVALVYKAVFFLLACGMGVAYPIYGKKLGKALQFSEKVDKKKQNFVTTIILLAAVGSSGLVLQSIILVYETIVILLNHNFDLVLLSVFIFIAEVIPTVALMYISRTTPATTTGRTRPTAQSTAHKSVLSTTTSLHNQDLQ